MGMLEKSLRMNMLFDFYGELLTEKQQELFRLYYHEDLTLSEAARIHQSSRQAVYDILRRAASELERYEQVLHLVRLHKEREALIEQLDEALQSLVLEVKDHQGLTKARRLLSRLREV